MGLVNDFIIGGNVTICRTLEFTESKPWLNDDESSDIIREGLGEASKEASSSRASPSRPWHSSRQPGSASLLKVIGRQRLHAGGEPVVDVIQG